MSNICEKRQKGRRRKGIFKKLEKGWNWLLQTKRHLLHRSQSCRVRKGTGIPNSIVPTLTTKSKPQLTKLQFFLKTNLHTQLHTIINYSHSAKVCIKMSKVRLRNISKSNHKGLELVTLNSLFKKNF